ncbi:RuvC family protein [Aureimonas psammosilenae]|uniref:hypothetical protein n=1 Tax=Aureimonas psammosilenae TaxID=2495496 RepID=UPI0012608C7C|nr:hypothetical protein [Aureimonas psammosilenae]
MTAPETCILGADPGASGAISFYFPSHPGLIAAEDVPLAAGEIDAVTLAKRIRQMAPTMAVIEKVGPMPKQGVSSTFNFGCSYGIVRGVVLALDIPTHLVTPGRWKKHFRLSADKEEARALALRLWPASEHFGRKKDHGRAEAALIARFGAETIVAGGVS